MLLNPRRKELYALCNVCLCKRTGQAVELTSSASSPDHGCDFAGPPDEAWCPAARQSVSGTFSSAAAQSAANPHYPSANQPAAAHTHTHTQFFNESATPSITITFPQLKCYKCETN